VRRGDASADGEPVGPRGQLVAWLRRALEAIGDEVGIDVQSHDFRRSLASYLIVAARADDGAVTGVMGHGDISITRRLYAEDWREADERNAVVVRQLADAGIGQ
jgi:integrase